MPYTPSSLKRRKGGPRASKPLEWKTAVLAATAGLVGALIGGAISLVGIERQATAARENSVGEFIRPERQAAYSEFLSVSRELQMDMFRSDEQVAIYLSNLGQGHADPQLVTPPDEVPDNVDEGLTRLLELRGQIELLGSEATRDAVELLLVTFSAYLDHLQISLIQGSDRGGFGDEADARAHFMESERQGQALEDAHETFLRHARQDLSISE